MRKNWLIPLALMALPTFGAAGPYDDLAKVEVLKGWRAADGSHVAGIRITLEPGWKTYWRSPGDGGIPPEFAFTGSDVITSVRQHWPVPEVFRQNGLNSVGYVDSVVFPITVYTASPEDEMRISGTLEIGVCEEICIPVTLWFDELLPVEGSRDAAIVAALINRPMSQEEADIGAVTCAIAPIDDGIAVTATIEMPANAAADFVVIEAGDANVWVSEADIARTGTSLRASVDMVHASGNSFALNRSDVRITVLGGGQAIDIQGCTAG